MANKVIKDSLTTVQLTNTIMWLFLALKYSTLSVFAWRVKKAPYFAKWTNCNPVNMIQQFVIDDECYFIWILLVKSTFYKKYLINIII